VKKLVYSTVPIPPGVFIIVFMMKMLLSFAQVACFTLTDTISLAFVL